MFQEQRCKIKGTVVGMRTRVGEGAIVEDSIIMGSDTYPVRQTKWDLIFFGETHGLSNRIHTFLQRISGGGGGVEGDDAMYIPIGIGKDTYIRKAIVDKNARIGKNVKVEERMKYSSLDSNEIRQDMIWFVCLFF